MELRDFALGATVAQHAANLGPMTLGLQQLSRALMSAYQRYDIPRTVKLYGAVNWLRGALDRELAQARSKPRRFAAQIRSAEQAQQLADYAIGVAGLTLSQLTRTSQAAQWPPASSIVQN